MINQALGDVLKIEIEQKENDDHGHCYHDQQMYLG